MYCTEEGYSGNIVCTVQESDTAVIYYVLYRREIQRADKLCTAQERDTTC